MRKSFKIALGLLFLASVAVAARQLSYDKVSSPFPQWFQSGVFIGSTTTNPVQSTTNKVAALLATDWVSYDYGTIGFTNETALNITCLETGTVTLTGAAVGDSCTVASNFGMDGGSAIAASANLSCRAVTNGVVGKVCIAPQTDGGTLDLADAGYKYFLRR